MLERLILLALLQTPDVTAADQLFNAGRFAEAEVHYQRLLQHMPDESALLLRVGACEYQLGNFVSAEGHFRKAVNAEPNLVPALVGLGTSLVALNRSAEALAYLEKAVKLAPSNRMTRRALGHAYVEREEFLKGEEVLRGLVEEDPQDWESWYYFGTLLFNRHYDLAALRALETSLKIHPNNAQAQVDRACALSELGRKQEAEALFQELARDSEIEKSPELLLGCTQLLFQNERYDEALSKIDAAIGAAPKSAKLHYWKARILFHMERTEEAIHEGERAVDLAPGLPYARNLLLRMYRALGRNQEAAKQAEWLKHYESKAAVGKGR